jgi:transposase-like protein
MNVAIVDEVLSEFSPEEKEKITQLILQSGINPRDPLIVTMATLAKIDSRIDRIPESLGTMVSTWTETIDTRLSQIFRSAVAQQKKALLETVKELLNKSSPTHFASLPMLYSLYLVAILGGVLALGTVIGTFISANTIVKFVTPSNLSYQDKVLLQWARSADGKQAKELQKINADAISFCKKQVKELKGKCVISIQN